VSALEPQRPLQILTFTVAGEEYAIRVQHVREVVEALPVTRVPSTPAVIRGVVNLRGNVVPLVDLGERFGVGALPGGKRSCIVVAEVRESDGVALVGLLVDAVNRVLEIPASEVAPPPPFGTRLRADLVEGVVRIDAKLVLIVDAPSVVPTLTLGAPRSSNVEGAPS
jgi:purine-binding chemotaxis protein CheW